MKSLPDMDISYGNHTEYKTPTIAGQLMLLGAPWVWDPAQHRVLSYPPGIDFTSKRETQLLVVIEANDGLANGAYCEERVNSLSARTGASGRAVRLGEGQAVRLAPGLL